MAHRDFAAVAAKSHTREDQGWALDTAEALSSAVSLAEVPNHGQPHRKRYRSVGIGVSDALEVKGGE